MHKQFLIGPASGRRGTGQLNQHRSGRKAHTNPQTAGIGNGGGGGVGRIQVITITGTRDAVIKGDVTRIGCVIIQTQQHDVLCLGLGCVSFAIIITLKHHHILVTPARPGTAAGKLVVKIHGVRHGIVAKLAKIIGVRSNRGVTAEVVVETITVDHRQAFVQEVIGILKAFIGGAATARILRLHQIDGLHRAEIAVGIAVTSRRDEVTTVHAGHRRSAEDVVHLAEQGKVQEPHAGI